jgi:long-chain acyl-CoA synthetase
MGFAHPTQDRSLPAPSATVPESWVFDVDGCLVDSLSGRSLRPGGRRLLVHLSNGGRRVLLWSAGGASYARLRAEQFSLENLVSGYYGKDGRDGSGFYLTVHLGLEVGSAVFVDDRPEDLDPVDEVISVSPYLSEDRHDRGLAAAARRAGLVWPTD